ADHEPTGANAADAATPGRLGTPAPPPDRGQVTGGLTSNPTRGLGAGAAAFCCASPAFPLAESFPETDSSAIRSTASAVGHTTAYRHRVTFAVLPLKTLQRRDRPTELCLEDAKQYTLLLSHPGSRRYAGCSVLC